jgi:hypothetical protein
MFSPYPKDHGFIRVGQEVAGCDSFLDVTKSVCARVLGVRSIAAISETVLLTGDMHEEGEANLQLRQRSTPVQSPEGYEVSTNSELEIVLLQRGMRRDQISRYSPSRAACRLKGETRRSKHSPETLGQALKHLAESHDEEVEGGDVYFDSIIDLENLTGDKIIGLIPRLGHLTTSRLQERATEAEAKLDAMEKGRLEKLPQLWNLAMPVAKFADDIKASKYDHILGLLGARLPVHGTLGMVLISTDKMTL